jgi:hypothetical protein
MHYASDIEAPMERAVPTLSLQCNVPFKRRPEGIIEVYLEGDAPQRGAC